MATSTNVAVLMRSKDFVFMNSEQVKSLFHYHGQTQQWNAQITTFHGRTGKLHKQQMNKSSHMIININTLMCYQKHHNAAEKLEILSAK